MLYPTITLLTSLALLSLAQGAAVDTDAGEIDVPEDLNILNKRGDYPGLTYDQVKKLPAKSDDGTPIPWAIGYWTEPDCKGILVAGHLEGATGTGKGSDRPCFPLTDKDGDGKQWMSEDDVKKIQSGAVYLQADHASHLSSFTAKLVVSGDKVSPCGTSNVFGASPNGWIGGAEKVPNDGWTCKNGKFTAHIVKKPKALQ
ncbi:MAG: hypothetical protein M1836_000946 [Candelina mexicana]|nr:MAG: hypothetical protein M1836_000946 [Candelina mexicana]